MKHILKIGIWLFSFICILYLIIIIGENYSIIPYTQSEYSNTKSKINIKEGDIIFQNDSIKILVQMPKNFTEDFEWVEIYFLSLNNNHTITLKNITLELFNNKNKKIQSMYPYASWENGYQDEKFKEFTHEIIKDQTDDKSSFIKYQSAFDFENDNIFKLKIHLTFILDNKLKILNRTLDIEKTNYRKWKKLNLRVH